MPHSTYLQKYVNVMGKFWLVEDEPFLAQLVYRESNYYRQKRI